MAGYSGTSLAKKLGLKSGATVFFHAAPESVLAELRDSLSDIRVTQALQANTDFILAFSQSKAELNKRFAIWRKNLAKNGCLWISWPKKTSGLKTDLADYVVREIGLEKSLVDIKVCAIDEQWSGLKFVYRKANR